MLGAAVLALTGALVLPQVASVAPASAAQDPVSCGGAVALTNGGFEQPVVGSSTYQLVNQAQVPGWKTTASDGLIELWSSGFSGVPAESGNQFAELNATQASTLYQDVATTPGQVLGYSLAHRGRSGTDTMRVMIGKPGTTLAQSGPNLSDGATSWGKHTGTYRVPAGQTTTRFAFQAVSSAGGSPTTGNFLDSISFGTGPCVVAGKTVTNLSGHSPAQVGDTLRYTLSATNNGGTPALVAAVRDPLATGVDYVPGSLKITRGAGTGAVTDNSGDDRGEYDASGRVVNLRLGDGATGSTGGTLNAGATTSATFDVKINRSAANGSIDNSASLTYTDSIDNSSHTSTTPTTSSSVAPAADLAVTKTLDGTALPIAGAVTPVSYTITASNSGPQAGTGVRVTDPVPAGLSDVTATTDGGTCSVASGTVSCTLDDLAVDASQTITVTGKLAANRNPGSALTNTATITGTRTDPDTSNNTATAATTIATSADLSMVKTFSPAAPVAGDEVTYSLAAANAGPSDARDVTITDPIDPGASFVSATVPGGSCALVNAIVTCDVGTLAANASATATVTVRLAAGADVVQNTATVGSSTTDPDATNNASSTSFAADTEADVRVTKAVTPAAATAGDPVTYTLHAINDGPSNAVNTVLSDTLPTGATVTDITTPDGATCTQPTDGAVQCTFESLAAGADETVTIAATIAADAPAGTVTNTAAISSPTPDPDTTNNAASADVTVDQQSDLALTKTADVATATAGGTVTFTLTATNNGPSTARGAVVRDALPATLTDATTSTAGCAITDGVLVCDLGDVAPDDSATATVTATVPTNGVGQDIVNTATVSSATPDTDADNNDDSVTVPVAANADVSVTKTASAASVRQGQPVTYTITVRNDGPSDAQDVVVQDRAGTGLTITRATPSAGTWDEDALRWSVGNLANGASATLTVNARADTAGTLTNTAVASSVTPDPDTADLTSAANVTATAVTPATAAPDAAAAAYGKPATINPLTNDTASTGATFDETSLRLRDADGNTVTTLNVPDKGRWSVDTTTGRVTFTPVAGFVGAVDVPYQVTDSDGDVVSSTITVTIAGPPDAADDTGTTDQGVAVTVPALDNDSGDDVDLDPASVRFVDPKSGALVSTLTIPEEGTYTTTPAGEVTFTPVPTFTGTATPVTYSVADDNGDRATAEITVTVAAADDPSAVDDEATAAYNTAVTINPTANDDTGDPRATFDPSSVRLLDPETGDPVTSVTVAGEGKYTVDTTTGLVTFTPASSFTGMTTGVRYTATTTFGKKVDAEITITVARPTDPTATDDAGYAPYGKPVVVTPLRNDDSGPAGTSFVAGSVRLIDPTTGDPVTTVDVADQGTWTVNTTTGAVTFAPADGFTGNATPITYRATTNTGDQVTATISPTIGTPPIARPDSVTVPLGQAATINVLANDAAGGTTALNRGTVRLRDADGAAVSRLVVPGKGVWTLGSDGAVVFTPADGFTGTITAPYQVTDGDGNVAASEVTVTVTAAPTATPDSATTKQGQPVTVRPLGNDTPSGTGARLDPTTLRLIDPGTGSSATRVAVRGQGVWTVANDGSVVFTPDASFHGTADPIGYRVTDDDGVTVRSTITVTVTEVPPTAKKDTTTTSRGGTVTIDPLENDTANTGTFDRGSLRLLDPKTGSLVRELTIPGEGKYVVDTRTGRVTFTADPAFTGTSTVRYSVADASGLRTSATISVTVSAGASVPPGSGPVVTPNPGPGGGVVITTPGGELAFTGASLWTGSAVAAALLLGGLVLLVLRRHRRRGDAGQ